MPIDPKRRHHTPLPAEFSCFVIFLSMNEKKITLRFWPNQQVSSVRLQTFALAPLFIKLWPASKIIVEPVHAICSVPHYKLIYTIENK